MKIRVLFFITMFILFSNCSNEKNISLEERLQQVLDKELKKKNERGVSAAIIFSQDSIWVGTSGISHDTISMKPDMLFGIGSVSKNFVSALTLKLVEDGTLTLEDKISNWLPKYAHIDPNITIRQLLNHTSGLYMFWNNDDLWKELRNDRSRIWQPEEVLAYIKEPHFLPGESWGYSNTNYLLLAMIVEKATGSTLEYELKRKLLAPLKLDNYYHYLTDSIPNNQAHVFGDDFQFGPSDKDVTFLPRASHESITFGSSGIVTTSADLAKWCFELFEGNVINENSMNEMLQFVEFRPNYNMKGYGLGVQLFPSNYANGTEVIGHGGGNIGSATYMVYLPEHHISIVVMVNSFPTNSIDGITKELIKQVIKQKSE